jgi:hypothetical protein
MLLNGPCYLAFAVSGLTSSHFLWEQIRHADISSPTQNAFLAFPTRRWSHVTLHQLIWRSEAETTHATRAITNPLPRRIAKVCSNTVRRVNRSKKLLPDATHDKNCLTSLVFDMFLIKHLFETACVPGLVSAELAACELQGANVNFTASTYECAPGYYKDSAPNYCRGMSTQE